MTTIKDTNTKSRNIQTAYEAKKYIVSYRSIFQPFYSVNAGYYAQEIYRDNGNMTQAGRYFHMTGDEVNRLLGFNHVNNL